MSTWRDSLWPQQTHADHASKKYSLQKDTGYSFKCETSPLASERKVCGSVSGSSMWRLCETWQLTLFNLSCFNEPALLNTWMCSEHIESRRPLLSSTATEQLSHKCDQRLASHQQGSHSISAVEFETSSGLQQNISWFVVIKYLSYSNNCFSRNWSTFFSSLSSAPRSLTLMSERELREHAKLPPLCMRVVTLATLSIRQQYLSIWETLLKVSWHEIGKTWNRIELGRRYGFSAWSVWGHSSETGA